MRSRVSASLLALLAVCALPEAALAFCGFYVASGEAKLFNHRSQVGLVRDGDRTVMTMASDYEGDPKEFALVVPVPVVLKRGQIHVGDSSLVARLDAYSAPRLVEYHDPDPCPVGYAKMRGGRVQPLLLSAGSVMESYGARADASVRIEARYEVDEYDVLILSADDSGALLAWLKAHGYRVPMTASRVVESYLKQGMKFFVAKVDLRRRAAAGIKTLRPLQIAYESPRFMLPVRLGMANADGPQELFVYAVTRTGRVEPVNYRSLKLPESVEAPAFVKGDFSNVWRAAFDNLVKKNGMGVVYTEYAWDMTSCDPCPSPPLNREEQRALGVWWLDEDPTVFVTRLHARYDRASFPEDLVLQVTSDRANFQAKVVVHNEWQGDAKCENANAYRRTLPARREREAASLAEFTGWSVTDVRTRMGMSTAWLKPGESLTPYNPSAWWEKLWKN